MKAPAAEAAVVEAAAVEATAVEAAAVATATMVLRLAGTGRHEDCRPGKEQQAAEQECFPKHGCASSVEWSCVTSNLNGPTCSQEGLSCVWPLDSRRRSIARRVPQDGGRHLC